MTSRQPASSQGCMGPTGLRVCWRRISSSSPFWRDPAERPAQPLCSMPWLPPGSGEPRSWALSRHPCWPRRSAGRARCRHPLGNLNRSLSSASPGAARYQCPLRRRRRAHHLGWHRRQPGLLPLFGSPASRQPDCQQAGQAAGGASHREGGQAQFIEQPVPASTRDARINQLLITCACTWPRPTPWTAWRNIA